MPVLQNPGLLVDWAGYDGRGRDAEETDTSRDEVRVDESWDRMNRLPATLSTSPLLGMSFDSNSLLSTGYIAKWALEVY
jgi:hypothetical protein